MEGKKFNGQRLREALQFREMKMSDLSRATDISRQSLSLYANGENTPPFENVEKIARWLEFPVDFFMAEDLCTTVTSNTYFRSQAAARKKEQNAQKIKLEYTAKMYEIFLNYVDFPALNLPSLIEFRNAAPNPELKTDTEIAVNIEKLAERVRTEWGLGDGPIEDMQYLLASHGIIVTGFKNVTSSIDAFSQKIEVKGNGTVFIVALAIGDKPMTRLNFDMAHELGHILMHNWDDSNEELEKEEFNNLERQANRFASALLLPRESFGRDVRSYATNVEFYRSLKKKWNVSMQAMMYRARDLEIITGNQYSYMMRTISAKGERTHERGDIPGVLSNTIFQGAVDVLFDGGYLTATELIKAFHDSGIYLCQKDMEDLLGLRAGTLNVGTKVIQFTPKVILKTEN